MASTIRDTATQNLGGPLGSALSKTLPTEHQFSLSSASIPDLSAKTALITGGSEGIGYAVAHTLLRHNLAHLHILSPRREVAEQCLDALAQDEQIQAALRDGADVKDRVSWHEVDLADWKRVREVGTSIADGKSARDKSARLDILVLNSSRGIMTAQTVDATGVDRHMAVNHFGHALLAATLMPLMKRTAEAGNTVRVSVQASNAHQGAPGDTRFASVAEINEDKGANAQYGRSKLANILYARYMARHLAAGFNKDSKAPILVNATHPGFVETKQSTEDIHEPFPIAGYLVSGLLKPVKKDQWEGAASTVFAATVTDREGEYVCPPAQPEAGSELARDEQLGDKLMELTSKLFSEKLGLENWSAF